jgi:hypothetical protein
MARSASKFTTQKALPKELPDGLEIVESLATVSEGDKKEKVSLSLFVPQFGNAAGIINFGKHYTEHNKDCMIGKRVANGNDFISAAIRSAIKAGVSRLVTPANASEVSTLILAPVSDIRTVKPEELVAARMSAWVLANPGKVPDAKVTAAIFAGITK